MVRMEDQSGNNADGEDDSFSVETMTDKTETPCVSVIIPAYNEEKRIGKTLDIIHQYLINQSYVPR